ncbi:hypothetical protein GCM10027361_00570 [Erwinia aphidicola]|uniref:hypothetical protein n=1 Tax=Erwinia aphidicola TaxID=68334 RepID=UPI001746E954|nr:hypothetical protein [Erwinia aphidicola]MBD1377226.1 hypothetical protein [Erwinia aphidicola]
MSEYPLTVFPTTESNWLNENVRTEGMLMRDYFAAKAIQGWLASYGPDMPHPAQNGSDIDAARNAYKLADAMLKARGE